MRRRGSPWPWRSLVAADGRRRMRPATQQRRRRQRRPNLPTEDRPRRGPAQPHRLGGLHPAEWVKPFEKQTGCQVHAKYAGSSDEMVTLMRQGGGSQYDMVSASGDASLRLIRGGDVAPVNVEPDPGLEGLHPAAEVAAAQHRRRQALRRSRCSGGRTRCSTTPRRSAPRRRAGRRSTDPKYKGQVTVPDNPIQIADAALYLSKTKPEPGHQGPVRADTRAARRRGRAAQAAAAADQEVLGAGLRRDRPVQERRRRDRRVVAVPDEHAAGRQGAGQGHDPVGGRDRLGGHVDAVVEGEAPELRLQVDEVDLRRRRSRPSRRSPSARRRPTRKACRRWTRSRRARARSTTRTPRRRTSTRSSSGRRRSSDCGNGKTGLHRLHRRGSRAWTEIKG